MRAMATRQRVAVMILAAFIFSISFATATLAHPLGNFTVNHFVRLDVGFERIGLRYVVDMAEIPAFQELRAADVDGDGSTSGAELEAYLEQMAGKYVDGLSLSVDGTRIPLKLTTKKLTTPAGAGGLPTLRAECDYEGMTPAAGASGTHRLRFKNINHRERTGWREIVVHSAFGIAVFDSSAYGNGVTDEIKAYPKDVLAAPLDERVAELSFARGEAPAGTTALLTRDGRPAGGSRDRLAELTVAPEVTPAVALLGLLIAMALGALHAFSPGHGKTVVGAYLIGSRGTPRHAAFLGLMVTITHTIGVFALGLVTLFASQYVVPERLFPILSFVSGGIVVVIGLSLFVRRLRAALGHAGPAHASHDHLQHDPVHDDHAHVHDLPHHEHPHHEHAGDSSVAHPHVHSHGGRAHSHLPPGADGAPVSWRSLLALGISGGLLPCPSALVVLLSAISLHRVGYGLLLVVAFSLGLAATLTAIGLAFVYAGRFMKLSATASSSRLVRALPAVSAFVIMCVGVVVCYEALAQAGFHLFAFMDSAAAVSGASAANGEPVLASAGAMAALGLGLVFGLKHATEVDHVVAVSTIVSEHRNITRAAVVGGLWGAGHTASLVIVGAIVLALRVAIPEWVAHWLEFSVALMITGLGANALVRALRRRTDVHRHTHRYDGATHLHVHFHESDAEHDEPVPHSHAGTRVGFKPLIVGAVHGLAGSAALTLLVLTQTESIWLGLLYLAVFGLGSVVGMMLMSGLVGLPFALSARKLTGIHHGLQATAGALSIAFGLWYAYETGVTSGLLRAVF